jgi:lactoylglutathione lyase
MKLGYVILYVPDVPAAIAFYESAFSLKRRFVHESQQYAELETGATALAFVDETFVSNSVPAFARNRPNNPPAGIEVGLVCDDVGAAYQAALNAGATPQVAPVQKPWGQTVAYVRDLNGCLVEICSPMGG